MQAGDRVVEISIKQKCDVSSVRCRQIASIFDVELDQRAPLKWSGFLPLSERDWSVGLIVGPSGSGKTTVARELFGMTAAPEWSGRALVDDFAESLSIRDIQKALSMTGLNTIHAWLRPFSVLSNGEQFRANLARTLAETSGTIVIDEFTSVVDRQVAKAASHAAQKYCRANGKQFVAVSCHRDIVEWLQPNWTLEPSEMSFAWRSLRRRPELRVTVRRVKNGEWERFAKFHYLTAAHNRSARCFCAFVDGASVAWSSVLHMPHSQIRDIQREHRTVVLPDWQGLGIGRELTSLIGEICARKQMRYRSYPSHPGYVASRDKDDRWRCVKRPGKRSSPTTAKSTLRGVNKGRTSAVYEWCGGADRVSAADAIRMWQ